MRQQRFVDGSAQPPPRTHDRYVTAAVVLLAVSVASLVLRFLAR